MSMILNLRGATEVDIDGLLAHPETIRSFLYPYEAEMAAAKPPGLLARLFGKRVVMPVTPPPVYRVDGEPMEMDLDKAWHAIHFMLTGSDWEGDPPLNFLLCGGTDVGDVDVGYGPARAMRPAEVRAAREALDGIGSAELRNRFDPAKMMEADIYPSIWDRDPAEDDTLGYVITYFEDMKSFLAKVTARNLGLLVFIN